MKKILFFTILLLSITACTFAQFPQTYSRSSASLELVAAIATDTNANVYVTGISADFTTPPGTPAMVTLKYDQNGNLLWTSPPLYSNATPRAIAVDGSGNVYIAGYYFNGSNNDFFVISYNSSGSVRHGWPRTIDSLGDDQATALVLASGNVYVTGFSHVSHTYGSNYDMLTVCYSSIGNMQWINYFDLENQGYASAQGDDFAYAIDAYTGSPFGNPPAIFICGKSWLSSQYGDAYITVQIDPSDGSLYWYSFYKYDENGRIIS